jgi:hypothetical protein
MKRILILMAKRPTPGQTKTRLMPALSAEEAATLYECFLRDKLMQMRQVKDARLAIAYNPDEAAAYFAALAPEFALIRQVGANLAERLCATCAIAFRQGYQHVVAIDGDTVTLPPAYLQQAFDALDDPGIDVALGPCEDGGYYAIGMKRFYPTLFGVKMSTPQVTRDTLAQADKVGLAVKLLPGWHDVDTPEDLARLQAELAESDTPTAHFLRTLAVKRQG